MITYIATAIIDLIVGLIALSRHDKPASVALALLTFSFSLWQTELYLLTVIKDVNVLAPWFHLTRTGMFFAPMMLALLSWRICGSKSRFFLRFILIPGFIAAGAVSFLNNTFLPSELLPADSGYLPKPDIILYLFVGIFFNGILGSFFLALFSYRKAPEREKRRIKWLVISLVWIGSFGLFSIVVAAQVGAYLSGLLGAISNTVFVTVLLYATINHHLTDVSSALSMLSARILALGITLGLYFFAVKQIEQRIGNEGAILFSVLFFIISLELYPRLLRLVHPGARKLVFSRGYDVLSVKKALQVAFKRSIEIDDLKSVLDHYLKGVMQISSYELSLVYKSKSGSEFRLRELGALPRDDDVGLDDFAQIDTSPPQLIMIDECDHVLADQMERREAIACMPLMFEQQLVGLLFVGPPISYKASYYRYDDIQMLEWLMGELPATLSRIVLHESLQDDLDEAHKTMSLIELMNQYHHDIKAPLSIIDGVVSNDLYDREKQHKIILEQVERGTQLITMMSNILRGQRERQTKPVNLESVITGCIDLFEKEVDEVVYQFETMSDVVGDANDLKILFINLIKNSIEAKQDDTLLKISVSGGESNDCIWIRFEDNGCGMSDEQLNELWTTTDSTKAHGSGIGLRAVKRIVDEHGANIEVDSEPGVGTSFLLRFSMRVKLTDGVDKGIQLKGLE